MISLEQIKNFFPKQIQENRLFYKYMIKEYLQLQILDYLSTSSYIKNVTFIGETYLRLVKGIDRFSEDLDFDCKGFSKDMFIKMTDDILLFLNRNGYNAIAKDRENYNLKAFRRNIYIPEFLFELGLSGHREERFLIKIESQDQQIPYKRVVANIKGCGFFFPFPVPADDVMCSMKISAMLSRQKGRDFYDVIFLLSQTMPNFNFLTMKIGIDNIAELKQVVKTMLRSVDLNNKTKDFEQLLFNKSNSKRILYFNDFFEEL